MLYHLQLRSWLTIWRSLLTRHFGPLNVYAFVLAAIAAFMQSIRDALQPAAARRAFIMAAAFLCIMTSTLYSGDANAALTGAGLWTEVKNFFFSEWGLVIGVVILLVAIGGALKFGVGWGFAMAGVGALLFLVPGGAATLQNWGKTLA